MKRDTLNKLLTSIGAVAVCTGVIGGSFLSTMPETKMIERTAFSYDLSSLILQSDIKVVDVQEEVIPEHIVVDHAKVESTTPDFSVNSKFQKPVITPASSKFSMERAELTSTPKPKPKPKPEVVEEVEEATVANTAEREPKVSPPSKVVKSSTAKTSTAKTSTAKASTKSITLKSTPSSSGSPKEYAKAKLASKGMGNAEYQCLVSLWNKESGWKWSANNPSSGAYGIPQSLPGSKMASAGSDWKTNPMTQVDWGLDYISGRYGTPCAAWGHSKSVNWY